MDNSARFRRKWSVLFFGMFSCGAVTLLVSFAAFLLYRNPMQALTTMFLALYCALLLVSFVNPISREGSYTDGGREYLISSAFTPRRKILTLGSGAMAAVVGLLSVFLAFYGTQPAVANLNGELTTIALLCSLVLILPSSILALTVPIATTFGTGVFFIFGRVRDEYLPRPKKDQSA